MARYCAFNAERSLNLSFFYESKDRLECRDFSELTYGDHFHSHLELFVLENGTTNARVDGVEYPMRKGDLFLAFPNQIHSYQDTAECRGVLCIFPYHPFEDLAPLFRRCVPASPVVPAAVLPPQTAGMLHAIHEAMKLEQPFRDAVMKGYLSVILGLVLPLMDLRDTGEASSDTVQSILRYCAENYQQDLTLESVAAELHISKYHISHLFSQKIRIGFSDFINMLRVQEACRQLKQGVGVTQASVQAGFNSIRSFNRVFLRQTGMTPLKYQKKYRQTDAAAREDIL